MLFVIKIGTSLLNDSAQRLDRDFLQKVISQIAALHKEGHEIIIVSSGAVAAGRASIKFKHEKKNIPYRQALAAIGQGVLMQTYCELFKPYGITVAQALLTNLDFVNHENFLNTKNVLRILLDKKIVPIVNENDVTTIAELKFGDNDMLSAKTAAMVSADCLFILTDVDGLFLEDPKKNPNAKLIPVVKKIDDSIHALATGTRSASSMGGMVTKLEAAEYVTSVGIPMYIVNGRRKDIFLKGNGTNFPSSVNKLASQKKWLRPKIQKKAWLEIDSGAKKAITAMGKSLLPSGVIRVNGDFKRGDVIMIKEKGKDIAYGQVNYDSTDIDKIKKHHSGDIEELLGFSFEDEIIHRNRMVITD